MRGFILIAMLLAIPVTAWSITIHVPSDYPTIQEAIDAAAYGDIIVVAPGTYIENIDFKGKGITLQSSHGPRSTVIDGGNPIDPSFGSVVTFRSGEGLDSIIEGFTLTNGTGTVYGPSGIGGGGIYCINHSSPSVRNNIIIDNFSGDQGGGVFILDSDFGRFTNNFIVENYSHYGGGVYVEGGAPIVANCLIGHNLNFSDGGGIYMWETAMILANCNIVHNENEIWDGGGIWCGLSPDALIANCNVLYNRIADAWGGGIYIYDVNQGPVITNCIVRDNWDIDIFGTAPVTYSNVKYGYPGTGNIDAPPHFVDPDGVDDDPMTWHDNDFHIYYSSPCRDAGNFVVGMPGQDMEGDPRDAYGIVDIGVDEFYTHLYCIGDFTPGGDMEGKFVGLPGANPVGLFLGSGLLDPPLQHKWGEFHLQSPWLLIPLGVAIPSTGNLAVRAKIPPSLPVPTDVFMQALIGLNSDSLTNPFVLDVR